MQKEKNKSLGGMGSLIIPALRRQRWDPKESWLDREAGVGEFQVSVGSCL